MTNPIKAGGRVGSKVEVRLEEPRNESKHAAVVHVDSHSKPKDLKNDSGTGSYSNAFLRNLASFAGTKMPLNWTCKLKESNFSQLKPS